MIVLPQNATLSYASHCAILGCFAQIRTASVLQAAGHVLRKFRPSPGNQRTGPALRWSSAAWIWTRASRVLRSDSVWLDARAVRRTSRFWTRGRQSGSNSVASG